MKKCLLIISAFLLLTGCNRSTDLKVGYSSNLLNSSDQQIIKKIFVNNKVSNTELFFKLLSDYNSHDDNSCGLKDWDKKDTFSYDEVACIDRYEKYNDISDGNCRLTAFMILQNSISITKNKKYDGTYLMFDIDVLENNKNYQIINNDINNFMTLFQEMNVDNISKDNFKDIYPQKWHDYGIKIKSNKLSLISVVMHDSDFNVLFVGHSGVLIDLDDKYIFVEKIAFELPYQFTVIKDKEELKELFENRNNYFGNELEERPLVYENDKLLFIL